MTDTETRAEPEDQKIHDNQSSLVDRPARRRSYMGHYSMQMLDVQKVRVATQNRLHAMERDGVDERWMAPQRAILTELKAIEAFCKRQLGKHGREHFMGPWIADAPGISHAGFARLIGISGDLSEFATVSKLWAYLGLHVVNGRAPKRQRGARLNWSPHGRVLCYQIAESIVRVNRGPYRAYYDRKREQYESSHPDWTPGHRHVAAMRYSIKMLIKHMWQQWRRLANESDNDAGPAVPQHGVALAQ